MAKSTLYVRTEERDFPHGEIEVVHRDGIEKTVEAKIVLTISEDLEDFKSELEELLKKYAI